METQLYDFVDEFKPGDIYYVLGAGFGIKGQEKEYADLFRKVHKRRVERGIHANMLFHQGTVGMIDRYRKELYNENAEIRFLPYKTDTPVAIFPHKEKTLLIIQEKEPTTIVINNRDVTRSFRRHFESLWNQKTWTYEGEDGVRAVFDEMLKYPEVWFIGGNSGINKYFPEYWKTHSKKRVENKVFWHDLIDANPVADLFSTKQADKIPYYECRVLPKELSSPHVIALYGNKVANIIWGEKTIISVIEDKQIMDGYKKYFDYLWKISKSYT
jgi:hypothetical protein